VTGEVIEDDLAKAREGGSFIYPRLKRRGNENLRQGGDEIFIWLKPGSEGGFYFAPRLESRGNWN
jgi:hypothetical protein